MKIVMVLRAKSACWARLELAAAQASKSATAGSVQLSLIVSCPASLGPRKRTAFSARSLSSGDAWLHRGPRCTFFGMHGAPLASAPAAVARGQFQECDF